MISIRRYHPEVTKRIRTVTLKHNTTNEGELNRLTFGRRRRWIAAGN